MHDMSSWNDLYVSNPKRQKASSSKDEAEGASSLSFENQEKFFDELEYVKDSQEEDSGCHLLFASYSGSDELEYVVKDSQQEGSGFHLGGLQDSSDCIEPGVASVLSRDSTQGRHGDEDGRYTWSPTSKVSSEQEADQIQGISPYSTKGLLSFTNWEGRQSQPVSTKGTVASVFESLGKKTDNLPQAQQLEAQARKRVDNDVHALERHQNKDSSSEPRGVPLALRLQELLQHSPATDPSTFVRHPQLKRKKGGRRWANRGKKSASGSKHDLSAIEDDIVEDFDSSDEVQKKSLEKGASADPCISISSLWERFQETGDLAPPLDTNPTSTNRLHSKQALSGLSERLRFALKNLKSQQSQFQQSLVSRQSLQGLSQCLVVLIMEKYLEAQLTTCHCKVLHPPAEWNDRSHAAVTTVGSVDSLPMIQVIFSSKMSGDLEFEVGGVVRVYPPWCALGHLATPACMLSNCRDPNLAFNRRVGTVINATTEFIK